MSELPLIAQQLAGLTLPQIRAMLSSLTHAESVALLSSWEQWSLPYQRLPEGDWRRWVLRAGRGTGKTYTGARTTVEVAKDRKLIRTGEIGIVGRTYSEARFVMVEGSSGILEASPPDFRPTWEPGNGILTFPNGVRARVMSADKPESGRGGNYAWIWGDEVCHWPDLEGMWWTVLEPALRIGWARAMLTTTPLPNDSLKKIEGAEGTVVTRAATFDNPYLRKEARESLRVMFEGTRIGRQELYGEILEDVVGALWTHDTIEDSRVNHRPMNLTRVVVAVDPAVTSDPDSDETGIVVAGVGADRHVYVLADRSMKGTPSEWANAAVAAYHRFSASRIVAEVNNGGDLVEATIRAVDPNVPYRKVHATRGKALRAEPVAALYERGKVHHVRHLEQLEAQLCSWTPVGSKKSPDRLDALVWAVTDLVLGEKEAGPLRGYL